MMDSSEGDGDQLPLEMDERLAEASRFTEEEQWGEAYSLLKEMETDYPEDPMLLVMLGTVAGEVEVRGLAYEYFRRALAAQPTDPAVLVLLGAGLARFDDPEAEGVLRLAAISAPHLAATRLQYGSYLAREGMHDLALPELEAARELDPDDPLIYRELAVAHWLADAAADAAADLDRALELAPDDAELRLLSGLLRLLDEDSMEGAENLVQASQTLDEDADVQIVASLAAAAEGWLDEAWNALARAEGAPLPPDPELISEVEDVLEQDEGAARRLLLQEVLPRVLRDRLLADP